MKIYCNTQDDQDLEFFESIAGTDCWVAVVGYDAEWIIKILRITYEDDVPIMWYTCVLKEDVDRSNGYSEFEVSEIINDPIGVDDEVSWCRPTEPLEMYTEQEIKSILMTGTC